MTRQTRRASVAAILAIFASSAAIAQDTNADPNYGSWTLQSGFSPDPRVLSVRAGGDIAASQIKSGCAGYITSAPDLRMQYEAGGLPLIISVASSSDTTLVVNAPDGRWHCNDDGGVNGSNPSIRFSRPASGRYEIWVGAYSQSGSAPARLHVSEVSSQ